MRTSRSSSSRRPGRPAARDAPEVGVGDRIGVLVIHGMGTQHAGFSAGLIDEVSRRLDTQARRVEWQEIHWANALQPREADLWRRMQDATEPGGGAIALDWQRVREFVVHNFGDAVAYQRDAYPEGAYAIIHEIVSACIGSLKAALNDPAAPFVVMAHSLGAHIMSNYVWDRQHWAKRAAPVEPDPLEPLDTLLAMITFGANIPLFSLAFPLAKPIDVPGAGIKKASLATVSRWLNFVDRDDVLGWPLRPLYEANVDRLTRAQQATVGRIEDHAINVGSLVTSWNPAAHGSYWTDNDFTRPVAAYLKQVLGAV